MIARPETVADGPARFNPLIHFRKTSWLTGRHRIFWISTDSQPDPFLDGFREGLRERGYVEGRNVALELYYAQGDPGALRRVIPDLTRGNIDLVVSSGPATRAIKDVTNVPVLFALSGDPIELGLVNSFAQPGGNFTGSTFLSLDLAGKRVELLKEIHPAVRALAVLSNTAMSGRAISTGSNLQLPPRKDQRC